MADAARYRLEELTPVVAALHKGGYFDKNELKVLVGTMHDFESKIKSTTLKKEDWKRYIDHQLKVEKLREIRQATRRIKKLGEDEGKLARKGIERHIHFLYSRAVHKFKGATDLWEEWIDFCRSNRSYRKLSKVVHEALSYNSGCTSLRLKAAEWEFDHAENPATARVLFQDGLRKVKGNSAKILWIRYFQMELQYVWKLVDRQETLGISLSDDEGGDESTKAEEAAFREVLGGGLAKVVLRNALATFPGDLSMRRELLRVLIEYPIVSAQGFEDMICCELKEELGKMPEAWDVVAQYQYAKALGRMPWKEALREATLTFEEGLQYASRTGVFGYHVDFILQQLKSQRQGKGDSGMDTCGSHADEGSQGVLKLELRRICKDACKEGSCSDRVVLCWLDLESEFGTLEDTAEACAVACKLSPLLPQAWALRLSMEAQLVKGADDCFSKLELLCLEALGHLVHSPCVWKACMDVMLECGAIFKPVQNVMIQHVMRNTQSSEMGELMGEFVCIVGQLNGIDSARTFCREITSNVLSLHANFYKRVIEMEEKLVTGNDASKRKRISNLYEAAVLKAGREDLEVWVDYARFEYSHGGDYGHLLWRAEKAGHSQVELNRLWQIETK